MSAGSALVQQLVARFRSSFHRAAHAGCELRNRRTPANYWI